MNPWLVVAAAFAVGSVPFGLLVARWTKGVDIREHGSGNIGATNVLRVAGKPAAAAAFVLDVLKGVWPPFAARALGLDSSWQVAAGFSAVLGHMFSPFLGFKGGKGIATSLGVLIAVSWKVAASSFLLWIVLVAATRYVSVASIAAAASLAPLSLLFYRGNRALLIATTIAGIVGIVKHRANIRRLLDGTENRVGGRPDSTNETAPGEAGGCKQ